jgi:hypothetical protein
MVAGKSSSIHSPRRSAVSSPLFVWKRAVLSGAIAPRSQSTCALASVACPHKSTSVAGVNHRRSNSSPRGTRNAVSERFISAATFCIQPSSRAAGSTHTAAGFPENGSLVKAST